LLSFFLFDWITLDMPQTNEKAFESYLERMLTQGGWHSGISACPMVAPTWRGFAALAAFVAHLPLNRDITAVSHARRTMRMPPEVTARMEAVWQCLDL